jgi:hypothetical protein
MTAFNPSFVKFQGLTIPWLKQLVAGLSLRRPGFVPESIHVAFVVAVAVGQVQVLGLSDTTTPCSC